MRKFKKLQLHILAALLATFFITSSVGGGAYAAADTGSKFDKTDVSADLTEMKIDGKAFSFEDYPAKSDGAPQSLAFVEYCYSFYANEQDNFALYIYIYNPAQLDVKNDSRNTLQMTVGSQTRPEVYSLKLLSMSVDKLYLKFRLALNSSEKNAILSALTGEDERVYDINGVELYVDGENATDYAIERKYVYTGYAAGYNRKDITESTLTWIAEGGTKTEPLEVRHTTWRPDGNKQDSGKYIQDSIHSVYFAVPNALDEKYDYLESVYAQWIIARTAPIFVTGNSEVFRAVDELNQYNSLLSIMSYAPDEFDLSQFNYALKGGVDNKPVLGFAKSGLLSYDYSFTDDPELKTLFWYFLCDNADTADIADNTTISSAAFSEKLNLLSDYGLFYNDKKVAGKYPSYLFESYDTEFHKEVIPVGKEYTLTSEKIVQSWWEKLFGASHVEDKETFKPYAIQEVESLTGNITTECNNYFIGESDYTEFKAFYDSNKKNSTIYLLRFATSDYMQMEVTEHSIIKDGFGQTLLQILDTNAYFCQTDVFLDFNIIDLEYHMDNQTVIIPVVASPIDVLPNLTPPVYTNSDVMSFWIIGAAICGSLTVFYVIYRIIKNGVSEAQEQAAQAATYNRSRERRINKKE